MNVVSGRTCDTLDSYVNPETQQFMGLMASNVQRFAEEKLRRWWRWPGRSKSLHPLKHKSGIWTTSWIFRRSLIVSSEEEVPVPAPRRTRRLCFSSGSDAGAPARSLEQTLSPCQPKQPSHFTGSMSKWRYDAGYHWGSFCFYSRVASSLWAVQSTLTSSFWSQKKRKVFYVDTPEMEKCKCFQKNTSVSWLVVYVGAGQSANSSSPDQKGFIFPVFSTDTTADTWSPTSRPTARPASQLVRV